jgi:hypothetical protein
MSSSTAALIVLEEHGDLLGSVVLTRLSTISSPKPFLPASVPRAHQELMAGIPT